MIGSCRVDAADAQTAKYDIVRFQLEASGEQVAQFAGAAVNLKDPAALAAGEMVVMGFAGELIASGFAGKFDRGEPPFVNERFDGTIDRGHAETFVARLTGFVNLRRGEWTICLFKDFADHSTLLSVAFGS